MTRGTKRLTVYVIVLFVLFSIINVHKISAEEAKEPYFADTKGHWIEAVANWGYENKVTEGAIVEGDGSPYFYPDSLISEEEFLTLYLRAMGASVDSSSSYKDTQWAIPYYDYALSRHYPVFNKNNDKHAIKREQVANIVVASMGKDFKNGPEAYRYHPYLYLMDNGYVKGKKESTNKEIAFAPTDTLTRAEALQLVYNIKLKGGFSLQDRPVASYDIPDEIKTLAEVQTAKGNFTIELFKNYSPNTTFDFQQSVNNHFYEKTSLNVRKSGAYSGYFGSTFDILSKGLFYDTVQSDLDRAKFAMIGQPRYYVPEDLGRTRKFELGTIYMGNNGLLVIPTTKIESDAQNFSTPFGKVVTGFDFLSEMVKKDETLIINSISLKTE